jgi:hypothetical protein
MRTPGPRRAASRSRHRRRQHGPAGQQEAQPPEVVAVAVELVEQGPGERVAHDLEGGHPLALAGGEHVGRVEPAGCRTGTTTVPPDVHAEMAFQWAAPCMNGAAGSARKPGRAAAAATTRPPRPARRARWPGSRPGATACPWAGRWSRPCRRCSGRRAPGPRAAWAWPRPAPPRRAPPRAAGRARAVVDLEQQAERRQVAPHRGQRGGEPGVVDDRPRPAVGQDVGQLGGDVAVVDVDARGPGLPRPEHPLQVFVPVQQVEGDVVVGRLPRRHLGRVAPQAQAGARQHGGQAAGAVGRLGPAAGDPAGRHACAVGDGGGDGLVEGGDVVVARGHDGARRSSSRLWAARPRRPSTS